MCRFFANTVVHYIKVLKIGIFLQHSQFHKTLCHLYVIYFPLNRNSNFFSQSLAAAFTNSTSRSSGMCCLAVVFKKQIKTTVCTAVDSYWAIFETCILMSFSKFPPSMCAPTLSSALSEELNAAALVPMDAFLLQLLPLRPFAEVVLQPDWREFKA